MIATGLKEIEAWFEWEGFSTGEVERLEEEGAAADSDVETDSADEDSGDEEEIPVQRVFDRESIEVAIDVFISQLLQEGIIGEEKAGDEPCLSDVFEGLFGENHPIVEKARSFEENTKGYFDIIAYDDMEAAYADFLEIQDMIKKEIGGTENREK